MAVTIRVEPRRLGGAGVPADLADASLLHGVLAHRACDDAVNTLNVALALVFGGETLPAIRAVEPFVSSAARLELARERGVRARATGDITGTGENKDVFMHLALDPDGTCNPAASFTSCPFGGHHMQLARGALWPCQVAAHHGDFAQRFGFNMHDAPDDSLPLAAIESADDIETFRRRAHPMCRFCDNGALTVAQWKPSKLEAGEWLA